MKIINSDQGSQFTSADYVELLEGNFWSGFASGAAASFMTTTAGVLTQNLSEAWQVTCKHAKTTKSTLI